MSKIKRYIVLAAEELTTLEFGAKYSSNSAFRERCRCVALNSKGYDTSKLMGIFNKNEHTIGRWLSSWEKYGLGGLYTKKGQGRPPKLMINNEKHIKILHQEIEKKPQDLKHLKEEFEQALNITLSKDTVKRFLKKILFDGYGDDTV
jgi:transposase